jgi:membrane protease YdiL (CAAX protease family)
MFVLTVGGIAMFGAYSVAGTNGWAVLVTPLMIGLASGFFEEILFRGVLFRMIEESLGSWAALGISALIFGGLHLLNENATLQGAMAVMLEAGIMLAGAYMFTRRLWLPIGIHIAWNFTQAGIFGIAVSGNEPMPGLLKSVLSGPTWLTGGEFGAEASVIAVLLGAVLGAFFIWSSFRKGGAVAMVRKQTSG